MNKTELSKDSPAIVSVNGWLGPTQFHCQVVAVWPAGSSSYYFIKDPSLAVLELLKHTCMWGGPSKTAKFNGEEVHAWEFHQDMIPWLQTFLERTKYYRPLDQQLEAD